MDQKPFPKYNQEIVDCVRGWDYSTGQAYEVQSALFCYCFSGEGKTDKHSTVLFFFDPLGFSVLGAAFPASLWPWKECSVGLA